MRTVLMLSLLAVSATAFALPPGEQRGFREGANHRVGDDSFVTAFGREPTSGDNERTRMKTHLQHVRAQLASQPATKPALEARRAELLGYLDDYIAKGITPANTRLPWRTPVFIDDRGNICAVGYLIERSVGRALPEKIAATHRYEFLEDIAAAMPEVREWVAGSGLTLDELASIQPGYAEPAVESWDRVDYFAFKAPDGAYTDTLGDGDTKGTLRGGYMEGTWTRTMDGKVVGKGDFKRGAGAWISFYPDGNKLAQGAFARNHPQGRWTLFHPSGNVAAAGDFKTGHRHGAWQFFNDTRARTLIATGEFKRGQVIGTWRHYDGMGRLLAVSRPVGAGNDPTSRGATLMTIVPGSDGVAHELHSFGGMDSSQLHLVARNGERLYLIGNVIYDAAGNQLTRTDDGWTAATCGWSKKRKTIAANGDVTTLHHLLNSDSRSMEESCLNPKAVSRKRASSITATLGLFARVRAPSPGFVKQLALGNIDTMSVAFDYDVLGTEKPTDDDEVTSSKKNADDLARVIAASLGWYIEWPHIDGRFIQLFPTIAGHALEDQIYTELHERNPDAGS